MEHFENCKCAEPEIVWLTASDFLSSGVGSKPITTTTIIMQGGREIETNFLLNNSSTHL